MPLQPEDLGPEDKWKVIPVTDEQLESTLEQINVTGNKRLNREQKTMFRELVAYAWSLWDVTLRPVDSPPVGLQFKDPGQRNNPIRMQPYRTNAVKLELIRQTIDEWIKEGIIEPAKSPWGFPVIMVPKPQNKGWRMCVDLRRLNEVIQHDSYQSPRNDDALVWLATKKIRSTLDIRWGYHNLLLTEEAKQVMTFVTTIGSFSYKRLPFGLATAGALFQRYMNTCLEQWLWQEAIAVVDDVAIGTETVEQHMKVVVDIVTTLAKRGFSVKAEKMKLVVEEFEFLGHLSTPTGLRATDRMIDAISKMPPPNPNGEDPKTQVKSFLGMGS